MSAALELILHRLRKQEWYTIGEAAYASGWTRCYISSACRTGALPAQHTCGPGNRRRPGSNGKKRAPHYWRIHRNDLALWIVTQSNYDPDRDINNVASIAAKWPPAFRQKLIAALQQFTPAPSTEPTTTRPAPKVLITLPFYGHANSTAH